MYWCKKLYIGETAAAKQKEILKSLKHRKWTMGIYVITLSENKNNLLDIYESIQFKQPYFRKKKLEIVGVASGKKEAFALVTKIIDDVYTSTGSFKVREFFITKKNKRKNE